MLILTQLYGTKKVGWLAASHHQPASQPASDLVAMPHLPLQIAWDMVGRAVPRSGTSRPDSYANTLLAEDQWFLLVLVSHQAS